MWLALPGGTCTSSRRWSRSSREEVNVRRVELIDDESALVERRVKPLLPQVGKRLGSAIPGVMAAARDGVFEILPDGSVLLAGVTLAADEVEILADPRPGTIVAHDDGLLVVLDTDLTADLRAEGDARELQRAIQDLRKDAGLELDDRIVPHVAGLDPPVREHLDGVASETLADLAAAPPAGAVVGSVSLAAGPATISIARHDEGRATP